MSAKTDGGPAFPGPTGFGVGMSLRDYFAAAVMPYYLSLWEQSSAAESAYQAADAMLKARES